MRRKGLELPINYIVVLVLVLIVVLISIAVGDAGLSHLESFWKGNIGLDFNLMGGGA